ncbi:MAG TPA: sulfatase [Candidatus Acidoferrales bacterium]|nr:sulfatase [Candidatus Acidoferrales bacterium]
MKQMGIKTQKPRVQGVPRRDFLKTIVASGFGGTLVPLSTRSLGAIVGNASASRPNVLYIHSHDTGRYIQPYGHAMPTPNLQRLAQQGILFRQAFSAAPTCSPSRASLLTGCCPHTNGMLGLAHLGFTMNDYKQHIIHTLRAAGYSSTLVGLQHIAPPEHPEIIGYDKVIKLPRDTAELVAPAAVEFLNTQPKQPFFLTVGFFETHRKFSEPGPEDDWRYAQPPAPIPDTPQTRQDIAAFKATVRKLDWGMGEVFRALEANGLAERTLVIATTDHGISFPAMKCNLTDHGIAVNLIMRGPGGFTGGKVCDAMISQLDVFPTICDLLEIDRPSWLQGKSFMRIIREQVKEINEEVFAEVNFHSAYEPKRCVRTKPWKYIRHYGDRNHPVLVNCDGGPSKDLWVEHDWGQRVVDREELFDLIFDPNETRNVISDASLRTVAGEMRARLDRWMHATDDPLLHGPVKAPAGAKVRDPDAKI